MIQNPRRSVAAVPAAVAFSLLLGVATHAAPALTTGPTKLTASDASTASGFGFKVSASDDVVVVTNLLGGGLLPPPQPNGGAYVFVRSGSSWVEQAKLTPGGGVANGEFGYSVDVDGGTIVVGARTDFGQGPAAGAVYVFQQAGSSWNQVARLTANDVTSLGFGAAVDLAGGQLLVGAPGSNGNAPGSGAAYVFQGGGSSWTEVAKLTSNDGNTGDQFGHAVAIDDCFTGQVVVGAPTANNTFANSGAAYTFFDAGSSWSAADKYVSPAEAPDQQFGQSVDIDCAQVLVGAVRENFAGAPQGRAFMFLGDPLTFFPLISPSASAGDGFGRSVRFTNPLLGSVLVGAPGADDFEVDGGAVYQYDAFGAGPPSATFGATLPQVGELFGFSVGVDDFSFTEVMAVGAPASDRGLADTGAIYIHEDVDRTPPVINCPGNVVDTADVFSDLAMAIVNIQIDAVDDKDPSPIVNCFPPINSAFPEGITTVNCTATDNAGNSSMCEFDVVIQPGYFEAPVAQPEEFEELSPAAWQAPAVNWMGDSLNANKIDDKIDLNVAGVPTFDIVINYRRPLVPADVAFVSALGSNVGVCKYLSTITVSDVTPFEVESIAKQDAVAFVEQKRGFGIQSDFSVKAIKAASSTFYSTENVEDVHGYDGTGINIAIVDSGVDNMSAHASGTTHDAFPASRFVAGYDAFTKTGGTTVDPDDSGLFGHGTKVATLALGSSVTSGMDTIRGVAPGAGLIDVKVFDDASIIDCLDPLNNAEEGWTRLMESLEWILDNHDTYDIRVVNMSIAQCDNTLINPPNFFGTIPSDGLDAVSQMVDLMSSVGIVVVCAAGNFGGTTDHIASPGAATRAITVGAAFEKDTVDRSDDIIWASSSSGPRDSDCDLDCTDELKPEVAAPGHNVLCAAHNSTSTIVSDSGTSLASPAVAGVAALLLEADSTLNPATIKEVIINTAEQMGSPSSTCEPRWDPKWGWGMVDAFEAVEYLEDTSLKTDLTFPGYAPAVPWFSDDITTDPFPPRPGEPAEISVMIENTGTVDATNVRVEFGVSVYSSAVAEFFGIATQYVSEIKAGETVEVTADWIPANAAHQCLEVEIGYGPDADFSNNVIQHNIIRSRDPVVSFQVRNTVSQQVETITIDTTCEAPQGGNVACDQAVDWTVVTSPETVMLGPDDDPVDITVTATPDAGATEGETITVHMAATIGSTLLGGVTVVTENRDCDGNDVHDYFQIQADPSLDLDNDGVLDSCVQTCGATNYGVVFNDDVNRVALRATGLIEVGDDMDLISTFCPPDSVVLTGLGLTPSAFSLLGGTWLVGPPYIFTFSSLADSCGVASLPITIPNEASLADAKLYWQSLAVDASQPNGFSLSHGVRTTICP